MMRHTVLLALLALLVASSRVAADPAEDAKPHIDHATVLYQQGKFLDALDELNIAYQFDPAPQLLYAIAQVYVKLGRCPDAISYYQRFLDTLPPDGPAAATREAIAHCKAQPVKPKPVEPKPKSVEPPKVEAMPAETKPAEPPPPPAPPPPPVKVAEVAPPAAPEPAPPRVDPGMGRPGYLQPVGDALVIGGVASGVVAILLYHAATNDLDAAEHAATYQASQQDVDRAHSLRTFGIAAAVGGGALIGAGLAYLMLHDNAPEHVAIAPTTRGGLVTWGGRF